MSRTPGTTRAVSGSRGHSARAGRARTVLPAALALLALAGCGDRQHARAPRVPVTVATVASRTMPFELISSGTIEPLQTAAVGSQVGGVVQRVAFREGDDVTEGQLLFQLDPRPFRATLDQAQAALERDRSQYEVARLEADRAQKLYEQNMLSEAEWQQKRNAAEAVAATMSADSAAVASARLNLDYASIRAPITGRTGQLMVHEGDYVKSATSDPLVTINQIHPVRVRFVVPDDAVALVQRHRNGSPRVRVRIPGADSSTIEGALVFVDNAVDPSSGTLLLKGEFANRDGRLVPGQFVAVRLVLYEQPHATVVPSPAVTVGQQGAYVFVLNPDSTVAIRSVAIERAVDEISIVAQGLRPGETVVTDGQLRLSPGAKVAVRRETGSAL